MRTTANNYARYLCRAWTTGTPPASQLSVFSIFFEVEWTPPPGVAKRAKNRVVWTHNCFG